MHNASDISPHLVVFLLVLIAVSSVIMAAAMLIAVRDLHRMLARVTTLVDHCDGVIGGVGHVVRQGCETALGGLHRLQSIWSGREAEGRGSPRNGRGRGKQGRKTNG